MNARSAPSRFAQLLIAASLAAYGLFGVVGHGLHGILPGFACCEAEYSSGDFLGTAGCCSCESHAASYAAVTDVRDGASAVVKSPGHDSATCSLCALLAKIKIGYAALERADLQVAVSLDALPQAEGCLSADAPLAFAARGPPLG